MVKSKISAGLVVYRKKHEKIEFFVGHPGGPYWKNNTSYFLLKGGVEDGETLLETAVREFNEESGQKVNVNSSKFLFLGSIKQANKTVYTFLVEMDIDETKCFSNKTFIEFPYKSGKEIEIDEIDDYKWCTYEELEKITHPKHLLFYQKALSYINDTVCER